MGGYYEEKYVTQRGSCLEMFCSGKYPIELRIEMIFFASKIQCNTKTESQSKILPDMNLYNDCYSHNLYLAYSNSSLCQIKFTDLCTWQ